MGMPSQCQAAVSCRLLAVVLILCVAVDMTATLKADPGGYIVYCPCMGRFGNQADQFLGALAFAKGLNRTLVLPAWVEYRPHSIKSVQIPFDTYFNVEALQEYHRVITMETFMKELAHSVWPPGQRTSFCYTARAGTSKSNDPKKDPDCNAKDGNPFKSFWDTYSVDFDSSEFYQPLYYDTTNAAGIQKWHDKYPAADFPVLAFTGAPGAFPVQEHHVKLHRYLRWSNDMAAKAQAFITANIQERPFLALHMRNGIDFKNACEHIDTSPSMFAAPQCIGYRSQFGTTTYEMCLPSDKTVVKQVKKEVKRLGAKVVFIATDDRDLIGPFTKAMPKVKFVRQPSPADPMLDLAILAQADHLIGNCISTFTAFAKRERDSRSLPTSFWAFPPEPEPPQEKIEL